MISRLPARAGRLLSLAAVTVALTVSGAGVATAKTTTVRDASGDVADISGVLKNRQPRSLPREKTVDITSVTTSHRATAVVVRVKVRKIPTGFASVVVQVRTKASGPAYFVNAGHAGTVAFNELSRGLGGTAIECGGLRTKVQPARRTVTVTVPRACIGAPSWVRTGALYMTMSRNGAPGKADLAQAKGLKSWKGSSLPLGPKVRRG